MDITTNQTAYRFPLLKNAEIIECLSDANIELSERELTEPHRHKEKVKGVFLSLVSYFSITMIICIAVISTCTVISNIGTALHFSLARRKTVIF